MDYGRCGNLELEIITFPCRRRSWTGWGSAFQFRVNFACIGLLATADRSYSCDRRYYFNTLDAKFLIQWRAITPRQFFVFLPDCRRLHTTPYVHIWRFRSWTVILSFTRRRKKTWSIPDDLTELRQLTSLTNNQRICLCVCACLGLRAGISGSLSSSSFISRLLVNADPFNYDPDNM